MFIFDIEIANPIPPKSGELKAGINYAKGWAYPALLDQRYLFQLISGDTNLLINLSNSANWKISDGRATVNQIYWQGFPSADIIHQVRKFEGNLKR